MALTGRICLALTIAASVSAAPVVAATRPGSVEMRIGGFGRDRILSVDTAGSDRIVIAGITDAYPRYHSWVRAFRPDGRPDSTFGGDGILEFDDTRGGIGAEVLGDGRIVVVQGGGGFFEPQPHVIRRLKSDGSPDQTFGRAGSIQPDFGGPQGTFLSDVMTDGAGRLIVVGATGAGSPSPTKFVVRRYLADGSRDTAFGTNGETILEGDSGSSSAGTLTPDGGVVLTFPVEGYPTLAHLSADGTLDGSFIGGGSGPIALAEPRWRGNLVRTGLRPRPVVLPDGRVRIAVAFAMPHEREYRIALVGLTAHGRPDLGFGFRGLALGPRPALPGGEAPGAAIADPSGSVIVAGARDSAMIRRFRSDGSLDRSFGDRGIVPAALPGGGYTVFSQSLALLGPDVLVAAEYTFDGKYQFWGSTALRTLNAGYDRDVPSISIIVDSCRAALVKIDDTSRIEAVARVSGRAVRRTTRKRFRVRTRRGGRRVSVRATDLAGNVSSERIRLPRC